MALGYTAAYGAAAASDALQKMLARRHLEQLELRRQAEVERSARATEDYRQQALQEQSRLREAQMAQTKAQQEELNEYRRGQLDLGKLRAADIDEYRNAMIGLRGEAETRQRESARDLEAYRDRMGDLRQRNMELSNAVAMGQLDARQAQLEIAKNNAELAQARLELDKLKSTPAHAGAIAGAQATAREAAKPKKTTLSGLIQGLFGDDQSAPPPGPAVGAERVINGQRAVWDGKGWLPKR